MFKPNFHKHVTITAYTIEKGVDMQCQKCGKETLLPFKCPYCGGYFCSEHRLPENHECLRIDLARAPKKEEPRIVQETPKLYEHAVPYIPVKSERRHYFSIKEVKHLTIAALLVFAVGLSFGLSPRTAIVRNLFSLSTFILALMLSFFVHEFAHKFAAQREGLWAEFRLIPTGMILTAISAISPFFKIISPGAVFIFGFADKRKMGKISIAGPATNITFSAMLILLWLMVSHSILLYWAAFNAWIALFNLIPFGVLDGFKVLLWNKPLWAATFTLSLAMTILTFFYL
ncbi:MAG: AN1-type zinc finger domain-containing protein [Candidatus Bathyarchaeia archaeon]